LFTFILTLEKYSIAVMTIDDTNAIILQHWGFL